MTKSWYPPCIYLALTLTAPATLLAGAQSPPSPQVAPSLPLSGEAFAGKIIGSKVRLRCAPSLESGVFKELNKGELIPILGQQGDFYAVRPPPHLKCYIFRTFVLDGAIEGSRVNVRLEPSVDAPILCQLQSGDKVLGNICEQNPKWLEINPPEKLCFYVAKDFVEKVGPLALIDEQKQRLEKAQQLLEVATASEKEGDSNKIQTSYRAALEACQEFPQLAEEAKQRWQKAQDSCLERKLALVQKQLEQLQTAPVQETAVSSSKPIVGAEWISKEDGLCQSWIKETGKTEQDWEVDQLLKQQPLAGTLEVYLKSVKNRPGDYVLRQGHQPVAYLYSTKVDLSAFVGKKVSLKAVPRENYHFALPAYFVTHIEEAAQ